MKVNVDFVYCEVAWIVDNRDGSHEEVESRHRSINAFALADSECKARNVREGWNRFVPLHWRVLERLESDADAFAMMTRRARG